MPLFMKGDCGGRRVLLHVSHPAAPPPAIAMQWRTPMARKCGRVILHASHPAAPPPSLVMQWYTLVALNSKGPWRILIVIHLHSLSVPCVLSRSDRVSSYMESMELLQFSL